MKSLQIKNYKNLNDFKIDTLAKVNLIVGKNNVGKSSLLEAISIFAAGGDVSWLRKLLESRGINTRFSSEVDEVAKKEKSAFETLYTNRNKNDYFYDYPIEIISERYRDLFNDKITVSLKLVEFVDIYEKDENNITLRRRKFLTKEEKVDSSMSEIMTGLMSSVDDKSSLYAFMGGRNGRIVTDSLLKSEYVRTSQIISEKNPEWFDGITLSPLQDKLIEALHIIEPRIADINFLKEEANRTYSREDNRVAYVVFGGSSERYRLTSMGDGVNRILTIILALLNCKDGVLLIDEFENGLHYSVQTQLWQMIYKLAEELNVQVFATTHSEDCIKSFIDADKNQAGKVIRLENRGGSIISVEYGEQDELEYISANSTEIR